MVDALAEQSVKLEEMKDEEPLENMRKMTLDERRAFVATKEVERKKIRESINRLAKARAAFVAAEMKKTAPADTLGEQMRAAVRQQSEKQGFLFKQ